MEDWAAEQLARTLEPLMRVVAIDMGNEEMLGAALNRAVLWDKPVTYERNGVR